MQKDLGVTKLEIFYLFYYHVLEINISIKVVKYKYVKKNKRITRNYFGPDTNWLVIAFHYNIMKDARHTRNCLCSTSMK